MGEFRTLSIRATAGKTVCGAAVLQPDGTRPAPHLLSVSGHVRQETLVQVAVNGKTNEIPVAHALLPYLLLQGRVVTADALHTQTAFGLGILDHDGDYLLCVKRNQPTLYDAIAITFADPATRCAPTVHTLDRLRGRTDMRSIRTTTDLNCYLTTLPRVGQVAEVTRTSTTKGKTTQEVIFLITSCLPTRAQPTQLLTWLRGHWSIEARHYIRDVTFGEDHSRRRSGHTPSSWPPVVTSASP